MQKNMVLIINRSLLVSLILASFLLAAPPEAMPSDRSEVIISTHPRIFITLANKNGLKKKAQTEFSELYDWMIRSVKFDKPSKMFVRLEDLRDNIYKCGYLYQMTGDKRWAELVTRMIEQLPASIKAYGGENNGYAFALEGLSIGYDWCYDYIERQGKKKQYLSMIDEYYNGNEKNFEVAQDFHNYAAQTEFAMFIAGLATHGDNPHAAAYLQTATDVMEKGLLRKDGVVFNVSASIDYVDGSCSWEGPTYGRRQALAYVKYAEAWRTATDGKINLWENAYSKLENAGYYRIYALQPDNLFANVGDVNYRALMHLDISILSGLQSAFQNPYFTDFLKNRFEWKIGKIKRGVWTGRSFSGLVFHMIWFDPDLPAVDLNELPLAKKFGDLVIIRNGFDENDTMVTFKSGVHWGFHTQLDHGSFTVFKGKPLAIDSGYYDNWRWGKQHNWNYWKRTIAHNSLLIYNVEETRETWPPKFLQINDGGQRCAFVTHRPPHLNAGGHNYPKSIDDLKKRFNEFSMGNITNYISNKSIVYINTNLTDAYNNKYSGTGNNPSVRANSVNRQFVYLENDCIIIFDTIASTSKQFVKRWLLHSGSYYSKSGKPKFDGKIRFVEGNEAAGIAESTDSALVTISEGGSSLMLKNLLPEKHLIRRIGGQGYEFWVDGKNWKFAQEEIPKYRQDEDPGAWRIEIEPEEKSEGTIYLNVLYPYIENTGENISAIEKVDSATENISGTIITKNKHNWIVLFANQPKEPVLKMGYLIPAGIKTTHLLFGCKPDTYYDVEESKEGNTFRLKLQESQENTDYLSSKEGMLTFETTF